MNDPLGAAALREAALTAWRASPARLREDANAEEDHSRGGYRDRVVVELAQNAADAAGSGGRLLLRLTTGAVPLLIAANTGSPLDAAGLASLATLRASAKSEARDTAGEAPGAPRPASVGRFGVGFAAVRSVADEIAVLTAGGSAHFSLDRTAATLGAEPVLADAVDRRRGALPALRLPFAGPGRVGEAASLVPGDPWATVVVLELRDTDAVARVAAQLASVDDALLLALPGLDSVVVEHDGDRRELSDVHRRWVVASAAGGLAAADLADRPVEEQDRRGWQLSWAVRRAGPTEPSTVHAPTPTDETCSVPALLIGTFPLDPSRRHLAPSTVTDLLVLRAGQVWAQLLLDCRQERAAGRAAPDPLDLVPRGWPAGGVDGALREAVLASTRTAPVLTAAGDGRGVAPQDAEVLTAPWTFDRDALDVLGTWDASLVRIDETQRELVRVLGIRSVAMSELVEQLPAGEPAWLRRVYDLFSSATGDTLAELAAVPVPLRDGRVVHGARGLVVVDADLDAEVLDALTDAGLRIVDPDAAHPVLERLGAHRLDALALARHPALRSWVLGELSPGEPDADEEGAAQVLLALLEGATARSRDLGASEPWWGEVLLEAEDGGLVPARGLVLPGSDAAEWFDPDVLPRVSLRLVERWRDVLAVVGVRGGLTAVRVDDPVVAAGIDGWSDFLDDVGLPEEPDRDGAELLAIADLDAVLPSAWPQVLDALAGGEWTAALAPVRRPEGGSAPAYAGWWLRRRAEIGADRPFTLPGATQRGALGLLAPAPAAVAGLLERSEAPAVAALLRALGGVASAGEVDAAGWVAVLDGLEDAAPVDLAVAVDLWRALTAAATGPDPLDDLARLPALVSTGPSPTVQVVEAEDVAVVDRMWAQLTACLPAVVVPTADVEIVARALDLDTAGDRADGRVTSSGHRAPMPESLLDLLPELGSTWVEHEDLRVDGERVDWWIADGEVHASTTDGLADGVSVLAGRRHRDRIARLLTDPLSRGAVLLDRAGDPQDG